MTDEQEPIKSRYAETLNALDAMQQAFVYAARRGDLLNAERAIVTLEKENAALEQQLAARERAVWLAAAQWCDQEVQHWNPGPEDAAVLVRQQARAQEAAEIAAWCRQQANGEKNVTPTNT